MCYIHTGQWNVGAIEQLKSKQIGGSFLLSRNFITPVFQCPNTGPCEPIGDFGTWISGLVILTRGGSGVNDAFARNLRFPPSLDGCYGEVGQFHSSIIMGGPNDADILSNRMDEYSLCILPRRHIFQNIGLSDNMAK